MAVVGRWLGALTITLVACVGMLAIHSRSPLLLQDTDTHVLLARLQERHNIWSWFSTDWPLQNHFYRPIAALSFSIDSSLWGNNAAGFGLSSATLCALCVLVVFWLAREWTDSPGVCAASAMLFAIWHLPISISWDLIAWVLSGVIALIGIARHGPKVSAYLPAVLATMFLATELIGIHRAEAPLGFYGGVMAWLPSRTATLMTLFCLCALASYVRFERLGATRIAPALSAIDLPATKSQSVGAIPRGTWLWFLLAIFFEGLALGSYEQAVMLPAILTLAALVLKNSFKVRWQLLTVFWVVLGGYFLLRHAVLPSGPSTYQDQQMRTSLSSFLSIADYVLPGFRYAPAWWSALGLGTVILLSSLFWSFPLQVAGNAFAYLRVFRSRRVAVGLWLASIGAFLPMAFLKPFPHYHYWAMSMRSIFVMLLAGAIWKMAASAVSPLALQAPPRPSPAPGSLRHPSG